MLQNVGSYRLLRLLGQGATARVYLGEHIHLQTHAAIKLLHANNQLSAFDKQEFVNEARTIANLRHQHIVKVLEFSFTDQGIPFLVMEYAEHGSLRQRHPRGTQLTPVAVCVYLEQIAAALSFIHQAGITHADIKPENLLLDSQQRLLLGDFGIATLSRQTMQLISGTPAYMAPEQIELHPCAASDQYALAIVTYEWLCGQIPFQGTTHQEMMNQHRQAVVPPLRQFAPNIAPEIEQVVLHALAKDPAARFGDVVTFVSAFVQATRKATTSLPLAAPLSTPAPTSTSAPTLQPTQAASPASGIASAPTPPTISASGAATTILRVNMPPASASPVHRQQGETLYTLNLEEGSVRTLAWSPDGSTLAAGCDYQLVFIWEALTGANKHAHHLHENQLHALAWSPNGQRLASACADQSIHIWEPNTATSQPLLTYRGHAGSLTLGLPCVVAWSPSGLLLASAGTDRTAQIWRAHDGALLCICRGHTNDINALCWSPDGTQIATASDDCSVRLWDARNGQLIAMFQHHRKQVYALTWSPDGTRLASAGEGNSIYTWQASATTQPVYMLYQDHARSVYSLAWSPDSTQLASAGRDRTVHIWQADNGRHHYTYTNHQGSVLALAWSPDGHHLASADEDGQVRVWQTRS